MSGLKPGDTILTSGIMERLGPGVRILFDCYHLQLLGGDLVRPGAYVHGRHRQQQVVGAVERGVGLGGAGASLPQLLQLLIELAEADSNLPQALRGHFAFVEDRLNAHATRPQDVWFKRFVDGDLVGNAWTEIGAVKLGQVITRVSRQGDQWVVNGTKYYSTGSIFADWIDLYAEAALFELKRVLGMEPGAALTVRDYYGTIFSDVGSAAPNTGFMLRHNADDNALVDREAAFRAGLGCRSCRGRSRSCHRRDPARGSPGW